jgi:hypothetical protein
VAITFVGASTGQTAAAKTDTSVTATPPSTIPGDVVFAWVDAVNTTDPAIAAPAGWNTVGTVNDAGSPTPWCGLYSRVVQAGDTTTPAFASTNATTFNAVVVMAAYRGVNTASPVSVSAFGAQVASSTSKVTDAISTASAQWIVSGFADKTAGVDYTAFSGTLRGQLRQSSTGIPSACVQDSAGTVAAGSITQSATGPNSSVGTSFVIALNAAARASLMPSGATETFTGTNGVSVAGTNFSVSKADNGGTSTIQSNACRLRTGTTAGNRSSIKLNGGTVADIEFDFVWTVPAASPGLYAGAWVRTGTFVDTQNGYYFTLEPTDMFFGKSNASYVRTDLQQYTHGFTAGQVVHSRIAVFGNTQKARTWLESNSEPTGVWQISATDTAQPSAGYTGITIVSGTSGAKDLVVDTFSAWDTVTPSQATLLATGGITPSGGLQKTVLKTFVGAITPTGALTKLRAVVRVFTGSITPAGVLKKSVPKVFAGLITPTGAMRKSVLKRMAGTIVPAAALRRSVLKRFSGTVTPAGVVNVPFLGRVFGRPGIAVMRLVESGTVRIRHRRGG